MLKAQDEAYGKNAGARGIGKSGLPPEKPTRADAGIDKKLSALFRKPHAGLTVAKRQ